MPSWIDHGSVRVAQADCLDALADIEAESIHAVIVDPPYCAGGFTEGGRAAASGMTKNPNWFQGDNMTTAGLLWLLRHVALEAHRVLADRGSLCLFCDWRMVALLAPALESSGLRWRNLVVWDKLAAGLGAGGFRARHELILHFIKGSAAPTFSRSIGNVIPAKRVPPTRRRHPTEKPGELLDALIQATTPSGGTVLDVFAGSGSLAEAALRTGRRAIVSDISPGYAARIAEMVRTWPTSGCRD